MTTSSPLIASNHEGTALLLSQWASAGCPWGDVDQWPAQLHALVSLLMKSSQPTVLAWGPELRLIYNDPYTAILGDRHPLAFGKPLREVWFDALPALEPVIQPTLAGTPTDLDDFALQIERDGRLQEVHFAVSYAPVVNRAGAVEGIYCVCVETTEAVLARRAQQESDRRRQAIVDRTSGFICVLRGPDHRIEFANEAYHRMAGHRTMVGLPLREAFPELMGQKDFELLDQLYASGERMIAHARPVSFVTTPGQPLEQHYIDFVYEPIQEADGTVGGIFVEGKDVTAAVKAQRVADRMQGHYRELLDAMGEGFVVLDEAFRLIQINSEGLRLDGRNADEILGKTHWQIWPGSSGTPVEAAYRQVMRDRVPTEVRHRYQDESHDVWMHLRIYPVSSGVACLYRDVSQAVAAEQALQESQERFKAAIAAIGVLWTNDATGRMVGEQPGWEQLTGQTRTQYQGYGWSQALHPEDAEGTLNAWKAAVADQGIFQYEHRVRGRDGQWRRYAVRAVPVFKSSVEVREWVGVHIDITEAAAAAEALRTADRKKDEFIATLAHELRNPLAPISTAAHLLVRPDLPPDKHAWATDLIRRQVQTMAVLLDDLLDISRITTGRLELRRQYVGLEDILTSAIETAKPLLDAKEHRFTVDVEPGLPRLHADPVRVAQILSNLLVNAAKYTNANGRIRLRVRRVAGQVELSVTDNGSGISSQTLAGIFEMFGQVHAPVDRAEGGLGIGLALSKGLVELHGGSITATSAGLDQGSTFTVLLPWGPSHVPEASLAPTQAADAALRGCRVMVVDDNLDAARSLSLLLETEGYEVQMAHDAAQALQQAEQMHPTIALLDIGLPGMSGYELAAKVRTTPWGTSIPLAAVTGWGSEDDRRRGMAAGFNAHFTKPVDPAALLRWVGDQAKSQDMSGAPHGVGDNRRPVV